MKIAYVSNALIPSRSANSIHVMKMCQALAEEGHEVRLLAPAYPAEHYDLSVNDLFEYYHVAEIFQLVKLPAPYSSRFLTYLIATYIYSAKIKSFLCSFQPDLVYGRYLPGCSIAARQGFKTVYEAHGLVWNSTLEGFLFKKIVKNHNYLKTVVISDALKKLYLDNTTLTHSQITIAHDGSDLLDIDQKTSPWPGRKAKLQVGYFGSLYSGRGVELILEVASLLPDIDFHIVGGSTTDIDRLRQSYAKDNVFFHGYIAPGNVHTYRNCCDILLAPYGNKVAVFGGVGDTSSFMSPLKIFEYMATQKAIVASDLPVLREILNEANSILVPADSVQHWQEAIELLAANPKIREELSKQAFNEFKQKYTWRKRAAHVIEDLGI